mgnify:CR=1 FL=1
MPTCAEDLARVLPARQVVTDELRRIAWGTDASFYRRVPEVIAVVEHERELVDVLRVARAHRRPVTFRAAGTSLSGQAVTDGVLALVGDGFATCEIAADPLRNGATFAAGMSSMPSSCSAHSPSSRPCTLTTKQQATSLSPR